MAMLVDYVISAQELPIHNIEEMRQKTIEEFDKLWY